MIKIETNWDQVKQDMVDDASEFLNTFKQKAIGDVSDRLIEKGVNINNIKKYKNKIVLITDSQQKYDEGVVYFDEVINEISDQDWPEII